MSDPPSQTVEVDFAALYASAYDNEHWFVRGHAIQAYASVENGLCNLLAVLLGLETKIAGTILFKISAYRARSDILLKLLAQRVDIESKPFYISLFKILRELDLNRNKIVHWISVANATSSDGAIQPNTVSLTLMQPNFFRENPEEYDPKDQIFTTQDMKAFIDKCRFASSLLVEFSNSLCVVDHVHNPLPDEVDTWRDIFQREVVYPPHQDHPLFRK